MKNKIVLHKVTSSQISEIGHSGTTLAIRFLNGSLYHYGGVTPKQFDEFKESKSIGSHFGKHFKSNDKHRYTRIHEEKKEEKK